LVSGNASELARGLEPAFIQLTVVSLDHDQIAVHTTTIRIIAEGPDVAVLHAPIRNVPVMPLSNRDPTCAANISCCLAIQHDWRRRKRVLIPMSPSQHWPRPVIRPR